MKVTARLFCVLNTFLFALAGCGADPGISGRYAAGLEGESMELNFVGKDRVIMTISEKGQNEQRDCSYQASGERITVNCVGGQPLTLTRREDALEANMDGVIIQYTKR